MPCNALSIKWCHTSARCENVRRADISSICSSCTPALQGISMPTLTYCSPEWLAVQKYELLIGLLYMYMMMICYRAERYQSAWHSTRMNMISAKILNHTTKDTTPGKIHHHTRKSPQEILYHTRCNIQSGPTKEQCIGTFYLCVSENSWLTHLDFHRTLHTGSSGVSKPTPVDDLLD